MSGAELAASSDVDDGPWLVLHRTCPCGTVIALVIHATIEPLVVYRCSSCRSDIAQQEHTDD